MFPQGKLFDVFHYNKLTASCQFVKEFGTARHRIILLTRPEACYNMIAIKQCLTKINIHLGQMKEHHDARTRK